MRQRTTRRQRPIRRARAAGIVGSIWVVVALLAASGCSSGSGDDRPASPAPGSTAGSPAGSPVVPSTQSQQALPPTIATPSELDGSVQTIGIGRILVVRVGADSVTGWSATLSDPAVARFTDGYTRDGGSYNPSFTGLAAGSSRVTLSNTGLGQSAEFTLTVTD